MNEQCSGGSQRTADPVAALRRDGFVRLGAPELFAGIGIDAAQRWRSGWSDLPADDWLRDGGRYRRRRHGSFVFDAATGALTRTPHRAHWQPLDYNPLHGGIERLFAPLTEALSTDPDWATMLRGLGALFERAAPAGCWFIEAHQFRIDTTDGLGRPTPEGAHRDGVDFVAVILVDRQAVTGGETRIVRNEDRREVRFTLDEPWSAVLLDDRRVIHETTPIRPAGDGAHRDTLVLTWRRDGFLSPASR